MRHFLTICVFALMSSGQAQLPSYVPTEDLVAWYPMNNSGDDFSGNEFHGEVVGSTFTHDRFGSELSSAYFDWASVEGYGNPWHRIEINPGFDGYLNGTFSVAAWIKPEHYYWPQNSAHSAMIFGYASRCPNTAGLRFSIEGEGALRLSWGNIAMSEEDTIALNEWQHVVGTIAQDSMRVYINGVQVGSAPAVEGPTSGCFNIGELHQANGHWYYFDGAIDDLGVWDHALSEIEISALYNSEQPILGCTDPLACNYVLEANVDNGSCISSGCMDSGACNFNPAAECEGEECEYACCPGPGCCTAGMYWDWQLQGCYLTNTSDSNFDGCVGMMDLLNLLSAFGTCEESDEEEWTCGDPVSYEGYDYATLLMGEHCWFAENLRSENYRNGDAIPSSVSDSEWGNTSSGAVAVYGEDSTNCEDYSPDGDACDEAWSLSAYGRLYNWYAVDDARGLCPSGWHVPTDGEWMTMEMALGMSEVEANDTGWRGTDQGTQMKSSYGWNNGGNGTNSSGFSGLPGGSRNEDGYFANAGYLGSWWSSPPLGSVAWNRTLSYFNEGVYRNDNLPQNGFSVRCVRDAE